MAKINNGKNFKGLILFLLLFVILASGCKNLSKDNTTDSIKKSQNTGFIDTSKKENKQSNTISGKLEESNDKQEKSKISNTIAGNNPKMKKENSNSIGNSQRDIDNRKKSTDRFWESEDRYNDSKPKNYKNYNSDSINIVLPETIEIKK